MAKSTNKYCDFCKKVLVEHDKKVDNENGFSATVGYSVGGWGSRKDFVPQLNVEICDSCFSSVSVASKELARTIKSLKK